MELNQEQKNKLLTHWFIDNEFLDKYVELINANRQTKKIKFKTQAHHIIPRAYFKLYKQPLDNSHDNIVNLSYKDHILAHYYLTNCTTDNLYYAMCTALDYLIKRLTTAKNTENALVKIVTKLTEEDVYTLIPNLEQIQEAVKIKESKRLAGGSWINNGKAQRYVSPAELPNFIAAGWIKGKLCKYPAEHYVHKKRLLGHTHWYTDGVNQQLFTDDEQIPAGWYRGIAKSVKEKIKTSTADRIPWNKGKACGVTNSGTWKPGHKPWNIGKHFSEETKKKMSEAAKKRIAKQKAKS